MKGEKRARPVSASEHENNHASLPAEKRKKVRWGSGPDTVEDSLEDDGTEEDTLSIPEKVCTVLMVLATSSIVFRSSSSDLLGCDLSIVSEQVHICAD